MQLKSVSIPFCWFTAPVVLAVSALLSVTLMSRHVPPAKLTNQSLFKNQSFDKKRVWTHYMPQLPDFNMPNGNQTPYGALYPLELRSSETAPSRGIDQVQRLQSAGVNGVKVLVFGSQEGLAPGIMDAWLSAADQHPGFVVAPCIAVETEDQAVNMVTSYASVAAKYLSAAKEDGKLVVFIYGSQYEGKTPEFWRSVRNRLNAAGIFTFLVNDAATELAVQGSLRPELLTPYFPVFDASYIFDDRILEYWNSILLLFNQYNRAYAGGILAGYNRETPNGGYTDAQATERYRRGWETSINAGLQWQTTITWNDIVEHSEIRPTSDWNWTRADITAFYSAKLRGTSLPTRFPQLYVTTPQMIHLGQVPRAEGMILNSTGSAMTVQIQLVDGNGKTYGNVESAAVPAYSASAAIIPNNLTINSFPARRFLRAKATMYNSAGTRMQQVTSAPILIYGSNDVPDLQKRTLYYSIPAAKALPGTVQLTLTGSPVSSSGGVTASVTPPAGTTVRFAEVLQNTRLVKNMFNQAPFMTPVPLTNSKQIMGAQVISTSSSGFYMARVIDEQERVGYSNPIYVSRFVKVRRKN